MSYPREEIALFDGRVAWGIRWRRPQCGCELRVGLPFNARILTENMLWALTPCPEHEPELERVLHTMQTMAPSEEEVGALFTRLLEAELAA